MKENLFALVRYNTWANTRLLQAAAPGGLPLRGRRPERPWRPRQRNAAAGTSPMVGTYREALGSRKEGSAADPGRINVSNVPSTVACSTDSRDSP